MLSDEYLHANIGFVKADNEPRNVWTTDFTDNMFGSERRVEFSMAVSFNARSSVSSSHLLGTWPCKIMEVEEDDDS